MDEAEGCSPKNYQLFEEEQSDNETVNATELRRNLIAFWLLGLCNNFGVFMMLAAAFDILKDQTGQKEVIPTSGFHCNTMSTGLVLLVEILPTLFIKVTAPLYMQSINYHIRVAFIILSQVASLLLVAFSTSVPVSLIGVVLASASSGAGEITFLSMTSHYKRTIISTWASGTGMGAFAGSFSYAGMTSLGLSPRNTLLLLLIVPALWAFTFWGILKIPQSVYNLRETMPIIRMLGTGKHTQPRSMSLLSKLRLVLPLWKYMIPLFIVFFAEYTINQGLYELLYYESSSLSQAEQYRWFQVDYQVAVFLSRSSVNVFQLRKIIIPAVTQWFILIFLVCEIYFQFIPTIWITLLVIFLEGMCGGTVYVNAFYMVSEDVSNDVREFCMGVASVADSFGVSLAAIIAFPIHDAFCKVRKQ